MPPGLRKVANFGTNEPWVARLSLGVRDIAKKGLGYDQAKVDAFRDPWGNFDVKLGEAFTGLVELRRIADDPDTPLHDLNRSYIGFYSLLWAAFKDRLPKALLTLGYDIGFLFVKDTQFESRYVAFEAAHPTMDHVTLRKVIAQDKSLWQDRFADYRNHFIEHHEDGADEKGLHSLQSAETMFKNVWKCAEDWTVAALKDQLVYPVILVYIPKEDRDPAKPEKFSVGLHPDVLANLPT